MRKSLFALTLGRTALASGLAWAQPAASPALAGWGGAGDLAWAGGALVVVLVVLLLFLKALQRLGRFRKSGRGSLFEMRGYQPLDNRKYLAAVAVDGRMLIIGVTPDSLVPLGQWSLLDLEGQDLFKPGGPERAPSQPAAEDPAPDPAGPKETAR